MTQKPQDACDTMNAPALKVRGLSLDLAGKRLLDGVSFDISCGCLASVIGPNGAGKTTLLKCLCRLTEEWKGSIEAFGRDVCNLSRLELARLFGYVPQFHESPPDYDVEEFLEMSRFAVGHDDERAAIDDALELVGLTSLRHRSMETLSGGECQKAFVAAGLVQNTPMLLLDEPAAFLDPKYQLEIRRLLVKLCRERGLTILCVTHDINSAIACSDVLLALDGGCLKFIGSPEEMLQNRRIDELFGVEFERMVNASGQTVVVPEG